MIKKKYRKQDEEMNEMERKIVEQKKKEFFNDEILTQIL